MYDMVMKDTIQIIRQQTSETQTVLSHVRERLTIADARICILASSPLVFLLALCVGVALQQRRRRRHPLPSSSPSSSSAWWRVSRQVGRVRILVQR